MVVLSQIETPDLREERLQKYLTESDLEKILFFKGYSEKFSERVKLFWGSRCSCREEVLG